MTIVTRWTVEIVKTLPRLEGGREAMIDGEWQPMTANVFRHHEEAPAIRCDAATRRWPHVAVDPRLFL